MRRNEISGAMVDVAYQLHSNLGPGLLESVYEELLAYELARRSLKVERQKPVPVFYDGNKIDLGFRADLVVEDIVLVELKSVEMLAPVRKKQVLTYLKISGLKLGLLMNFGTPLIKDGIVRMADGLPE
ncbi:MAG TPA: GxxExxY protein [Opitutaceae bacterium]|nr:GxxExxY protein [Opitutaceae bacterium]